MPSRLFTAALTPVLLLVLAAPAGAFESKRADRLSVDTFGAAALEPAPLTGQGENLELIANVPIDKGDFGVAASDLELHGNHAFVGSYGEAS